MKVLTRRLICNNFIIYRTHYIKYIDKFFKFIFHRGNILKILVLLLPRRKLDSSKGALRIVHIVAQQSHTNFFVCSVQYVNYVLSQFQLFIHVFGHCRYQHWGQVFLSSKIFWCNDELIPQSYKLVEICLSHCKILDRLEHFVVHFVENIEFYIQDVAIFFGPRNSSKSVLTFAKVHIVGTT